MVQTGSDAVFLPRALEDWKRQCAVHQVSGGSCLTCDVSSSNTRTEKKLKSEEKTTEKNSFCPSVLVVSSFELVAMSDIQPLELHAIIGFAGR